MTVCTESPERGVYGGVVKRWRRDPKGGLWEVMERRYQISL